MKPIITLAALILCAISLSCREKRPQPSLLDISLENASTNDLKHAELTWAGEGPFVPGGFLGPGIEKTTVAVDWPAAVRTATVSFTDVDNESKHSIEFSLEQANSILKTGHCSQVKIRILSYDRVEVVCE